MTGKPRCQDRVLSTSGSDTLKDGIDHKISRHRLTLRDVKYVPAGGGVQFG